MDHFGIGAGIKGVVDVYFRASRRSGRTIELVESLKDGDRVVFTNDKEANRVRDLCRKRGVDIVLFVCSPRDPGRLFESRRSSGRTIFDHSWLEEFYQTALDTLIEDVDRLQAQSSGPGAAHRETRRAALELSRWAP